MSQTSQISRYRPAVIAVTGVAAAFGVWTLYSAFADQGSKESLHRSNAVRRSRRLSASSLVIDSTGPSEEEPFGSAIIRRNGVSIGRIVFARDRIPSPEEWQNLYGTDTEQARSRIAGLAVEAFLQIALLSHEEQQSFPEAQRLISEFGMRDIFGDVGSEPAGEARRYRERLSNMLGSIGAIDLERLFANFTSGGAATLFADSRQDIAETDVEMLDVDNATEPAQGLKGLLYYIAEEKAKREAYEHRGIRCDYCNESPIRGIRWHCLNCPDVDLCSTCEASFPHPQSHVFVKVKIPLPAVGQPGRSLVYPVWYPGKTHIQFIPIQPALRKRLAEEYRYEEPQIDALYDQFITSANVPYPPDNKMMGIDRKAFDRALTIEAWTEHAVPNALYDRMFAFYDRGNKGIILFEDFVDGMAYLRGPNRYKPLKRALQGFDVDGDGYINREDFLLLLRAKYDVQKALIAGASNLRIDKLARDNSDVLKSSQPISAMFCEQDIQRGEPRSSGGKQRNENGDLELGEGTKTVLGNDEVPAGMSTTPGNVIRVRSMPHLQRQLARLDRAFRNANGIEDVEQEAGEVNEPEARECLSADGLSSDEAAALGIVSPRSSAAEGADIPSTRNDVIWQYAKDGYKEALDPIFQKREKRDRDVANAAEERSRWRKEIDRAMQQKEEFEENLRTGAELDPLVAAAAHSYDQTSRSWITNQDTQEQRSAEVQRGIDEQMRDSMLPTDTPSLDKFEKDIQEQSLEELLAAAGYSVDSTGETEQPASSSAEAECSDAGAAEPSDDSSGKPNGSLVTSENTVPSQERLEYLASLDDEEKLIEARGGAGRMSYDEIEELASRDREIKGLITGWLELASF